MNHPIEEIILASGSPRRKELRNGLGSFRVVKSECEEITTKKEPCDVVMELSQQKAFDVYSKLSEAERRGRLVLGADTIVAIHGRILGKPKDQQDAISMLQELSGKIHHVYTGVTLLWEDPSGRMQRNTFYEDTEVEMYPMSMQEIENYVATGEPMDQGRSLCHSGRLRDLYQGNPRRIQQCSRTSGGKTLSGIKSYGKQ